MRHHQTFTQPSGWLADHHDFSDAAALVFAILAPGPSWRPRHRLTYLLQKLKRAFIEAHHRIFLVERTCVNFDDILHAGDKLFIDFCDAPLLLLPGL